MKKLCFFLKQLFIFRKKNKKIVNLNSNSNSSIEMSNISTFNLEKHANVFHKYKPPPLIEQSFDDEFESSSSDDELFTSCNNK